MKKTVVAAIVVLALVVGGAVLLLTRGPAYDGTLTLHGNVDLRQVSLAFEDSGRIDALAVEEGDRVRKGDRLARLDTTTLALQARQAEADLAGRQDQLRQLRNGSRPEEIAQARATLAAAQADVARTASDLARLQTVSAKTNGRGVSAHDLDAARSAAAAASARAREAGEGLALARKGPREEQIAAGSAQVDAASAQLALLRHRIAKGTLIAPSDGVVRSRLLEVGAMASPQTPVYDIALTSPKWVRVYVTETDLGRIRPGMAAQVTTDAAPDAPVTGHVGYISSVAEFTPKSVETEDLRTALVYEVRIMVTDKDDRLRLGQPVTVRLDTAVSGAAR
ncbi:efflux RND transporter periplasmic adaptor subunit [Novosphingobium sp. 1949]|uniref:Efflux RND transporter periplasmic adaptor subunit n=1 Tax=Novosphingobium organovorum TaxID=2930092 RepID=A0ABT0B9C5_9SPHN|nr:efflux RND transporter periplasmic adaptor subunit [Novosphingobium organovorum]MCJ2181441.1 efflux RND transporter periplasmic adaptor subunit [Novosphingobium organovorum]